MKEILWYFWKKRNFYALITYIILLGILFFLYSHYSISTKDPLLLFSKIFLDFSNKIPSNFPFIYLVLSFLLPYLLAIFIGFVIKYYLLPGNKSSLLEALLDRSSEVSRLGCNRIVKDIQNVASFVDGLRTGCNVTPEDCQIYGREVIEITKAKTIYATCLQKPQSLYDNLRGFSEIVASEVNKRKKNLIRIMICNPQLFDLNSQAVPDREKIKWFVNLHTNALTLGFIELHKYLDIASACGVRLEKLDIMLFDKKIVYTLENDINTYNVIITNGHYRLYLMDSTEDIKTYKNFISNLVDQTTNVMDFINEKNLISQYSS